MTAPRTCDHPDCSKPHRAKGFCSRHYQRLKKHGDPGFTNGHDPLSSDRRCAACGVDISDKRSNAVACSRRCKEAASRARLMADPERLEEQRRKDRDRYPREREARKAQAIRYYHANRDERVAYARTYRVENPHRRRAHADRRAERMRDNPGYAPYGNKEWERLKRRHDHSCAYCGVRGVPLQQDHVIPLARGGRHAIANILPACFPCNSSKGTDLLVEWRRRLERG